MFQKKKKTYGEIISAIKRVCLNLCNDLRLKTKIGKDQNM
jgi:hypothetical protein